jgi:predicted acylesterase/phospholipase RssA
LTQGADGQLRIGLTISGAIALGAYEGGALAALLAGVQAVNRETPGALRVDVIAGASAGSITGLLAARALSVGLNPIDVMYGAWVTTPQLEELRDGCDSPLSTESTGAGAEALLKGDEHREIAQRAPIRLSMALGCLRGLDYEIGRIAGSPVQASTFLDWSEETIDGTKDPQWYMRPGGPVNAALASGAHAAAFPPIGLDRSALKDDYEDNGILNFPPSGFLWYTDGGTIDNQPLGRAVGMSQDVDCADDDAIGGAARLHMMITPDPARPTLEDDRWSARQTGPSWARTGLRATKLARSQHLYADLRDLEKTNSRLEWARRFERAVLSIIEGGADPEPTLRKLAEGISGDKGVLLETSERMERKRTATATELAAQTGPESPVAAALREALEAATGLAGKRYIAVAVVSPLVLPEVADDSKAPRDVLAGDFLGHFGGFLNVKLRENDFSAGYRSMVCWMREGLEHYGLAAAPARVALEGAEAARAEWESRPGNAPWLEDLGGETLKRRPWKERLRVYKLAWAAARMAFRQVRKRDA